MNTDAGISVVNKTDLFHAEPISSKMYDDTCEPSEYTCMHGNIKYSSRSLL
jgi:hypothetical protein